MANTNPDALMYERKLTHENYFDARWISRPLCLFDNCLESDGAVAIVMTSAERARELSYQSNLQTQPLNIGIPKTY